MFKHFLSSGKMLPVVGIVLQIEQKRRILKQFVNVACQAMFMIMKLMRMKRDGVDGRWKNLHLLALVVFPDVYCQ